MSFHGSVQTTDLALPKFVNCDSNALLTAVTPRPFSNWPSSSLVFWTPMPRGGHFAALEEPQLLAEDIREFFRPMRGA